MRPLSIAVLLVAALPSGALAQTAANPMPGAGLEHDAKAERKVCRSAVPTGSMMSKRVCRTKAEWAQTDADNAATTNDLRNRSLSGTPTGG